MQLGIPWTFFDFSRGNIFAILGPPGFSGVDYFGYFGAIFGYCVLFFLG